ncbi:MAG TPA: VOC family protein [Planctomycetaceae bacterium]|jgi:catechol 2,3-dioxygenase-like lactoylglutathione lyase family enzyme|nr:VOC family protein [Planctomycetaceae bacterium]
MARIIDQNGQRRSRVRRSGLTITGLMLFLALSTQPTGQLLATEFRGVRLNVSDPQAAAEWYCSHLGGTLLPAGPHSEADPGKTRVVSLGKVMLVFAPGDAQPPIWPVLGSVGSGVDHLGFGFADLDRALERFTNTGVEIVSGIEKEGPIRYAFIRDRWGTLIELVEDRELQGFHHIHLATTDSKATLKWYTSLFGGQISRYGGMLPGIRYGDVWVLVKTAKVAPAPTDGRAIGGINWAVTGSREILDRVGATNLPHRVTQLKGDATEIQMAGPDRVQLSILATGK